MSRIFAAVGIASLIVTSACSPTEDAASVGETQQLVNAAAGDYALDRVIVRHRAGTEQTLQTVELPSYAGQSMSLLRALGERTSLYRLPAGVDPVSAAEALASTGDYDAVDPDYRRAALATVNDPFQGFQWHLSTFRAAGAWDYSTGAGAVVAVLDTGCTSGSDGYGAPPMTGYDFVNGDSDPADDDIEGHGTHVTSIIGQASDNGIGVAGLAYDATILPVKVLDNLGAGYDSDVIDGINYAVAQGADIINLSLGGGPSSSTFASAIQDAWEAGVFLSCAAGNDGVGQAVYPARYSGCVAVSATDMNDNLAPYSNFGNDIDLAAAGGNNLADVNGDGYADGILQESFENGLWGYYFRDGTSMAAPQVAAAAAMLMANGASNVEALECLINNADDIGSSNYFGAGLIRADLALEDWQDDGNCVACLPRNSYCTAHEQCCSGRCRMGKNKCR